MVFPFKASLSLTVPTDVRLSYFMSQKLLSLGENSQYRYLSVSISTKERCKDQEGLGVVQRGKFNSLNMLSYYSQGSSESPLP